MIKILMIGIREFVTWGATHIVPRATAALELASLLKKGSSATTCPRLWTPPLHLGGLQRCHMPRGSGPPLTIQEGSGAATSPSAPDPASPLRGDLTLTLILQPQTTPTSVVGYGVDTCLMALHGL
jgi:hypothetical protein